MTFILAHKLWFCVIAGIVVFVGKFIFIENHLLDADKETPLEEDGNNFSKSRIKQYRKLQEEYPESNIEIVDESDHSIIFAQQEGKHLTHGVIIIKQEE